MVKLKFDPGFRVIREYLSQIDSNILQLLGIPGQILLNFLGQNDFNSYPQCTVNTSADPLTKSAINKERTLHFQLTKDLEREIPLWVRTKNKLYKTWHNYLCFINRQ